MSGMELASTGDTCSRELMPYKPRHMFANTIRPTNVVPVVGSSASTAFGNATVRVPPVLDVVPDFGAGVDEHAPNRSDSAAASTTAAEANKFLEATFRPARTMGADIPASFALCRSSPPGRGKRVTPAIPEGQR